MISTTTSSLAVPDGMGTRLAVGLTIGMAILTGLLWATPMVWKPWVFPGYAAQRLAADDGKGLVYWMPDAARFWGHRIYEPLAEATEGFEKLRPTAAYTLLDILGADRAEFVREASQKLVAAKSRRARLLGCYAAMKHALRDAADRCPLELRDALSQKASIDGGIDLELALRIAGQLRMPGISDLVTAHLRNDKAPFWVRIEACNAAARLPERSSFKEEISKLEVHVREGCQKAVATISNS